MLWRFVRSLVIDNLLFCFPPGAFKELYRNSNRRVLNSGGASGDCVLGSADRDQRPRNERHNNGDYVKPIQLHYTIYINRVKLMVDPYYNVDHASFLIRSHSVYIIIRDDKWNSTEMWQYKCTCVSWMNDTQTQWNWKYFIITCLDWD